MHSTEGDSWTRWTHEVRRAEFEGMLKDIPLGWDSTVLELGCGDGFQLSLLRQRFAHVFAIDPAHMPDPAVHGTYPGHLSELRSYGRRRWAASFVHPQLVQLSNVPLICATQFGFLRFRFLSARKWLGGHGLDSSRVFVVQQLNR